MYKFIRWDFIKTGVMVIALTVSGTSYADVLCKPTSVFNVMYKSNGDIVFFDWEGKKHLAFKANSNVPEYIAEGVMRGLIEAMVQRKGNNIRIQASYPDGYDCSVDDTTTPPIRIVFNQTKGRY